MARGFDSATVRAAKNSSSLRVTIPQVIVTMLGLRPGDSISWEIDPLTQRISVAKTPGRTRR